MITLILFPIFLIWFYWRKFLIIDYWAKGYRIENNSNEFSIVLQLIFISSYPNIILLNNILLYFYTSKHLLLVTISNQLFDAACKWDFNQHCLTWYCKCMKKSLLTTHDYLYEPLNIIRIYNFLTVFINIFYLSLHNVLTIKIFETTSYPPSFEGGGRNLNWVAKTVCVADSIQENTSKWRKK